MSSTTGALLILAAGLGSMGYATYIAVSSADRSTQDVKEMLRPNRDPVHVRFITHESEDALKKALSKLRVPYKPQASATKVVLSSTSCEVHVLVKSGSQKPSDKFIATQVESCTDMITNFKGKRVSY